MNVGFIVLYIYVFYIMYQIVMVFLSCLGYKVSFLGFVQKIDLLNSLSLLSPYFTSFIVLMQTTYIVYSVQEKTVWMLFVTFAIRGLHTPYVFVYMSSTGSRPLDLKCFGFIVV